MGADELAKLHKWAVDNYERSPGFRGVVQLIEEYRKSELARVVAVDRVSLLTKLHTKGTP